MEECGKQIQDAKNHSIRLLQPFYAADGHIDVIFPINQIVSDGVKHVACDIDQVEILLHDCGHSFGVTCCGGGQRGSRAVAIAWRWR